MQNEEAKSTNVQVGNMKMRNFHIETPMSLFRYPIRKWILFLVDVEFEKRNVTAQKEVESTK